MVIMIRINMRRTMVRRQKDYEEKKEEQANNMDTEIGNDIQRKEKRKEDRGNAYDKGKEMEKEQTNVDNNDYVQAKHMMITRRMRSIRNTNMSNAYTTKNMDHDIAEAFGKQKNILMLMIRMRLRNIGEGNR